MRTSAPTFSPLYRQIKEFLMAGKLVIVPAAGRQLGNPYYKAPGPVYHMLVRYKQARSP